MKEISIERVCNYFETQKGKVTLGIDGFVDDVWEIVQVRNSPTDYVLYEQMKDFAKSVYDTGAGGYSNEIVRKRRGHGGFTAHAGEAVKNLGVDLTLVGMFGKDGNTSIDTVFSKEFQDTCKIYSVWDAANCPIYEFTSGKILMMDLETVVNFDWDDLTAALSPEDLSAAYKDANLVGMGYWSMMNKFDNLVAKLCENTIKPGTRVFFDFADIRKRTKEALMDMLGLLARLNDERPMSLSLNEHEAVILFSNLDRPFDWKNPEVADKDIGYVRQQLGLDEVIVHTPFFAVAATASEGTAVVRQRYCENPVLTTGAGDNFNGGYMSASAQKGSLNLHERLLVANATTGFYIRNGFAPNRSQLKTEMEQIYSILT
ncbi:MAG: carbohydrate kinase family protein [Defluviitaleaceae bacterium]|nr:carbohydrate kinase family protein [Defluviitaleaceae bacterium]